MTRCSSTSKILHVWLRPPPPSSVEQRNHAHWLPIDEELLQLEFLNYQQLLIENKIDVTVLPHGTNPDSVYLYDTLLHTPWGVIIYQSRKPNRTTESNEIRAYITEKTRLTILGQITSPGYVDGGDIFWLTPQCLALGLSWRTNKQGAKQLKDHLAPFGIEVRCYDLPDLFGEDICLHLMSLVSLLRDDLALVYAPAVPIRLRQDLRDLGYNIISIPTSEWDTATCFPRLATNALSLGDNRVISLSGNPITAKKIRDHGIVLTEFSAPNLCNAGMGGPTCLTSVVSRA